MFKHWHAGPTWPFPPGFILFQRGRKLMTAPGCMLSASMFACLCTTKLTISACIPRMHAVHACTTAAYTPAAAGAHQRQRLNTA